MEAEGLKAGQLLRWGLSGKKMILDTLN